MSRYSRGSGELRIELIVIGTSTGGLHALKSLFSGLPARLGAAVALVQHRGRDPGSSLVAALEPSCPMPVREPADKEAIRTDTVYVAPAGYHLLVEPGWFSLSTEGPVQYCRPSVDVLFESAAIAYRERLVGVILTGANVDGAQGLAHVRAAGGICLVQDPTGAEAREMPEAAVSTGVAHEVLPVERIARRLVEICAHRASASCDPGCGAEPHVT